MMKKWLVLLSFVLVFCIPSWSWCMNYTDPLEKFSITVPDSWKTKGYKDGSDRVLDAISRDGNVMVRARVIELPKTVSLDMLQKIYEKKYVSGKRPYRSDYHELSGIDGQMLYYNWFYNGHAIDVKTFIGEKKSKAYIISRIIPKKFVSARAGEADDVIASFVLKKKPSPPVMPPALKPEPAAHAKALPKPTESKMVAAKRPKPPAPKPVKPQKEKSPSGPILPPTDSTPLTQSDIDEVMSQFFY